MELKYADNSIYMGEDENNFYAIIKWREHKEGVRDIYTTRVDQEKIGQGLAGRLTQAALEKAREDKVKVFPTCSYVQRYMDKHQEYKEILYRGEEIPE